MPKNLDIKSSLVTNLKEAIKKGDENLIAVHLANYAEHVQNTIIEQAQNMSNNNDAIALTSRNVRQLTGEETKYYQSLISAMKSNDPKQELTKLELTLPITVVESVFEDIRTQFPLLEEIDFKDGGAITNMILCKDPLNLAVWGPLGSSIEKQINSSLMLISNVQCKLSAFLPVANDMLDLGAQWIDRYVRETLTLTIAYTLEHATIAGNGKNQPIGMIRDISDTAAVTNGSYPEKSKIEVTSLAPVEYGNLVSKMVKNEKEKTRKIENLIMIVNPIDYLKKIMPATTVLNTQGQYVSNVLPLATKIIESESVKEGSMILGLAKKYKLYASMGKQARITYDDSVRFLDDARVYAAKLHANGRATDNNDFILCDISKLEARNLTVVVASE